MLYIMQYCCEKIAPKHDPLRTKSKYRDTKTKGHLLKLSKADSNANLKLFFQEIDILKDYED